MVVPDGVEGRRGRQAARAEDDDAAALRLLAVELALAWPCHGERPAVDVGAWIGRLVVGVAAADAAAALRRDARPGVDRKKTRQAGGREPALPVGHQRAWLGATLSFYTVILHCH